jgi:hypothetical protein
MIEKNYSYIKSWVNNMQRTNIFDFDETISVKHTFHDYKMEKKGHENQYELGKRHAKNNTKSNIDLFFKHNDHQHTCAIATYHNNPQFIAGYVAHILNKELHLENVIESHNSPKTSINQYKIEGIDKPFFISYIPETGTAFGQKTKDLRNKNKQLSALREVLLKEGIILETWDIHFYDDTQKNYDGASELNFVNSYSVTKSKAFECHLKHKSNMTITSNNIPQKMERSEMLTYIQKEIIQEAIDVCECYKNQYKVIPNIHTKLANTLIYILNDIQEQLKNQEIYFCILIYLLKVMRQQLENESSVKFLKKNNRLTMTYNLEDMHLNKMIEEMFEGYDTAKENFDLSRLYAHLERETNNNRISHININQTLLDWSNGNKNVMTSNGITKGEPLFNITDQDHSNDIENYREDFITEHKKLYASSVLFFRDTNININYTDEMNTFIMHAKRNNNRSRQAFINMGWMDAEGNFTPNVPTVVKQVYYSQLSNVNNTDSHNTMHTI